MISIYTYLLIVIALTLLLCVAGFSKSLPFSGVGLALQASIGATPSAGKSINNPQLRNSLRLRHAAAMPIFAAENLFSADTRCYLPIALTQRKELHLLNTKGQSCRPVIETLLNQRLT